MGLSKPWPEALKAMTGEDKMDATAIIDYFGPLKQWLDARKPEGRKESNTLQQALNEMILHKQFETKQQAE